MDKQSIEILKQRAIKLAKPKSVDLDSGIQLECLVFEMADTQYAIETTFVDKVLQIEHIFSVPGVPPFILGIINDGGRIISINDGSQIFNLPKIELHAPYTILILKNKILEIGVIVKSVVRIQKIAKQNISKDLLNSKSHTSFQIGLTKDHMIFLDGDLMLKTPGLLVDQSQNL